jgi:anaerobic magnesium-protoporphyrin IX monomethyl ester cyclase
MKIYLLNPPYFPHFGRGMRWQDTGRGGTLYYPIWLSYAAAVVEQEHEIRLVDAPAWNWGRDDVTKDAARFDPDLIVLDSSFPSLNNDISVAESLKEHLDCKIVLVGPPGSQFPEEILKSGVDIVARWEYDFTVSEIADTISEGGSMGGVEGISYREDGIVKHNPDRQFTSSEDLDRIPFVSKVYKNHLNIKDYFLGSSLCPEVQIFTGRGCPFRCTFCSWPQTLMGRKYRVRSTSNLLDELEWIQDNLDVKEVFFEDDTFTISEKRVLEFCRGYKERGLDVTWACNARVSLDYETMREMKNAHCRLMIAGYESGSDEILTNVKKGSTVDEALEFSRNARKSGLLVHGDFIIGLPGETKETMEMTRNLIKEVHADILQVSVASPFPGTEFYEWCKENRHLLTDDPNEYLDSKGHQKAIISYPWLTAEEITSTVDGILKGYYLSLNYIPLAARQVMRRQGIDEMRRLWYSVKMFMRYIADR